MVAETESVRLLGLDASESEAPNGETRPRRRLAVSLAVFSTLVLAVLLCASLARDRYLPKTVWGGQWSNGVTSLSDGECDRYPYLKYQVPGAVSYNNLGNRGPDSGHGEGLVYKTIDLGGGAGEELDREVYLVVNATNLDYFPFAPRLNGIQGKYGSVNMKSGSKADLLFNFYDRHTMQALTIPEFAMTFFDLDTGPDSTSQEYVIAEGYASYHLSKDTEVKVEKLPDGRTRFMGTTLGNGQDNPRDPNFLTEQQRNRAVTFLYGPTHTLEVTLGATNGIGPRFFTFVGRPALLCSVRVQENYRPPLPDLEYEPPKEYPVQVLHGEKFVSWAVAKGDKVNRSDVIAVVQHGDDDPRELLAAHKGTVKEIQDKLRPGDSLDKRLSEKTIAVIERPMLNALPVGDGVIGGGPGLNTVQNITEKTVFLKWLVAKGEWVRMGQDVAAVSNNGKELGVEAVNFGIVKDMQPLEEGDLLSSVPDANILTLGPLVALGLDDDTKPAGQVPEPKGRDFLEYKVKPGDVVQKGDTIAIVENEVGDEEAVKASGDGVISELQRLEPGTPLDRIEDGNLATTGKFPPLPLPPGVAPVKLTGEAGTPTPLENGAAGAGLSTPQPIGEKPLPEDADIDEDTLKFVQYYVKPGDVVETGDKIAEVEDEDGEVRNILSPRPGVVRSIQEGLQPDMQLKTVMKDDTLATLGPLPGLVITPDEEGAFAPISENWELKEWKVEEGDQVQEGDPIAVLVHNETGEEKQVLATKNGTIIERLQHLKPGDQVEQSSSDDDLATIGPSDPEVGFQEMAVEVPSMDCTFVKWHIEMDQEVNVSDGIADVQCPGHRRLGRSLGEGDVITVPSPGKGRVSYMADLTPGKTIAETAASPMIAKVKVGWPSWIAKAALIALILVLCCCLCCLCRRRKAPVSDAKPEPVVVAPVEEKPEGLRLDFADENGTVRTYYAKYRPLGIKHRHAAPIIVSDFTVNSYAKQELGVKKNYKLVRVDDLDLNDSEDFDMINDKINDHMQSFDLWPLPLEFRKKPTDATTHTYKFTQRPLGLEFTNEAPILVDKVHPDSPAEEQKVEVGWYLTRVGDSDVAETTDFRKVLRYLKEGVQTLEDTGKSFGARGNNNKVT